MRKKEFLSKKRRAPQAAAADLVFWGGNVITLDPGKPAAEAVAVKGGRFLAAGPDEEVLGLAGKKTEIVALRGRTVTPGFIDSHQHLFEYGTHLLQLDCSPRKCRSLADIQKAVRRAALRQAPGEWIRGAGYDDTKMPDRRPLNRWDLDEAASDHPVLIQQVSGHWAVANSRALEKGGVKEDAPDPEGGSYGRDSRTGRLNGILYEQAEFAFVYEGTTGRPPILPPFSLKERLRGVRLAGERYLAAGLTGVHDALVSAQTIETYQETLKTGDLKVRMYMLVSIEYLPQLLALKLKTGFGNEWLRLGGVKILADGGIAGRTAYLNQPYVGTGDRGILAVPSEEALHDLIRRGHEAGFQVCVHANGDRTIEMALNGFEKALAARPRKNHRHRLEHCTVVNPEILRRIRKNRLLVTPFGSYIYFHGEKMNPHYGPERVSRMFAHRSFLDRGIAVSGASDSPCGPFEPLLAVQSCVTRKSSAGEVLGANQAITVEEALFLYTRASAYASFEEEIKGAISPGKLGDLVVLGEDPRRVPPDEIKDIPVEMTVVGGEIRFKK